MLGLHRHAQSRLSSWTHRGPRHSHSEVKRRSSAGVLELSVLGVRVYRVLAKRRVDNEGQKAPRVLPLRILGKPPHDGTDLVGWYHW